MDKLNPFAGDDLVVPGGTLGELEDKYQVLEEIGTGRFGVVRRVRDKAQPGAFFACKTLLKADADNVDELRNEVRILQRLNHPHVVGVVDVVEDREAVHLISELCTGGELFDRIIDRGTFSETDAAVLIRQVLLAIEYLHTELHLVHRDLKPENLLFSGPENDAALRLIDFGMTCDLRDDDFMHSSCGSPSYVAPEVLDRNYTEKCDTWSTGVILYILLCGKVPFAGTTDDEIMRSVSRAQYTFDDPAWADVSESAISLVRGLMHVNPLERLSASEALEHKWIRQLGEGHEMPLRAALSNMRSFQSHIKLKKATLRVIARHIAASSSKDDKDKYMIKLREIFASLDRDNRGAIQVEDLARAILDESKQINAFNVLASAEELAEIVQNADLDRNGLIDLSEFVAAALNESVYLQKNYLKFAFDTFDLDGSGGLSLDELRAVYGDDTPQSLEEDFRRLDLNNDGNISYEEFCEMMRDQSSSIPRRPSTRHGPL